MTYQYLNQNKALFFHSSKHSFNNQSIFMFPTITPYFNHNFLLLSSINIYVFMKLFLFVIKSIQMKVFEIKFLYIVPNIKDNISNNIINHLLFTCLNFIGSSYIIEITYSQLLIICLGSLTSMKAHQKKLNLCSIDIN